MYLHNGQNVDLHDDELHYFRLKMPLSNYDVIRTISDKIASSLHYNSIALQCPSRIFWFYGLQQPFVHC